MNLTISLQRSSKKQKKLGFTSTSTFDYETLIVEDDKVISKIHQLRMNKLTPTNCIICFNGKEALDYLDSRKENKSTLILLDINMPVMDGWEFLDNCHSRAYNFQLVVIIVTSSLFDLERKKAKEYELVKGYYSKPLKPHEFIEISPSNEKEFNEIFTD